MMPTNRLREDRQARCIFAQPSHRKSPAEAGLSRSSVPVSNLATCTGWLTHRLNYARGGRLHSVRLQKKPRARGSGS